MCNALASHQPLSSRIIRDHSRTRAVFLLAAQERIIARKPAEDLRTSKIRKRKSQAVAAVDVVAARRRMAGRAARIINFTARRLTFSSSMNTNQRALPSYTAIHPAVYRIDHKERNLQ
jgi:hypothetical protein